MVDDETNPIYCEIYVAKLVRNVATLPKLAAEFEEITDGEEWTKRKNSRTKWAALVASESPRLLEDRFERLLNAPKQSLSKLDLNDSIGRLAARHATTEIRPERTLESKTTYDRNEKVNCHRLRSQIERLEFIIAAS